MSSHGTPFPYPPLPTGVDAIRVLTVEPGDFLAPLVCNLVPKAFSEKPAYVALSYTWGSSYPDNSNLPTSPNDVRSSLHPPGTLPSHLQNSAPQDLINALPRQRTISSQTSPSHPVALTLNGQTFYVGHNLYLALLHLRSRTHPISIWADAICINQADIGERSQQVSIMSFIYTRATRVVAWLGTNEYRSKANLFRSMSAEWKAGHTQYFAAALAGASKLRCSPKPNQGTFARIVESSYWTRLWIVQEVCLPRFLVFVYGSNIWTYEEFRQWHFLPFAGQSLSQPGFNGIGAMLRLLETRENRHTGMMTLESLIERFSRSACSEPRDRVYGILGCANDIIPFTGQDEGTNSLKDFITSQGTGLNPLCEPRRGIGSFRVDYLRSFYDIWTGVVKFVFFQAKNIECRVHIGIGGEAQERDVSDQVKGPPNEERCISIVRIAGIVQDALDQKVEQDLASASHPMDHTVIRAIGYVAGEIVRLGPHYKSLVASSHSKQEWTSCWDEHYHNAEDLEKLRRIDEEYAAKIMDYEQDDMDRIRDIRNPHAVAWRIARASHQPSTSDSTYVAEYEMMWENTKVDEHWPRMCLGTGFVVGLAPPAARLGDVIVRFWNCDAAVVMRPIKIAITDKAPQSFMLVGRADVAESFDRKATPGQDQRAEQCMSGIAAPGFVEGSQQPGAVYIDLNLKTLQMITAHIAT